MKQLTLDIRTSTSMKEFIRARLAGFAERQKARQESRRWKNRYRRNAPPRAKR
jgi:hypothetical protein